ncbi:hypothetical protein KP509_29G031200 [Ceratopteris richardii]|uniref:Protein kinase domain-containing protein n=1 Tax=Ceratopteris richardii TaxID=49495 RepID=A0A8T2R5W5_CERRI|nr:hypothetical protein KP509_29G031200 [Ceratopteris richardii]
MSFIIISRRAINGRKERKENFQRNGGDQLVSCLFSERELLQAIDNFSRKNVIGQGGFAKVYFGKLSRDNDTISVAMKREKAMDLEQQAAQMQTFVRELLLLRKAAHKNVVQLLGCCVETPVPLLVYEYVEKGTVRVYLKPQGKNPMAAMQGKTSSFQSMWAWLLHVAVGTAEALEHIQRVSAFECTIEALVQAISCFYSKGIYQFRFANISISKSATCLAGRFCSTF